MRPFSLLLALVVSHPIFAAETTAAAVDGALIQQAPADAWLTHGYDYAETRASPLRQITPQNVGELGLAWYFDTNTRRGLEATPLVVGGVMYSSLDWSEVIANDAKTGELLWRFDPRVPRTWGGKCLL